MVNLTEFQKEHLASIYFAQGKTDPHAVAAQYLGVNRQEAKLLAYSFFYTQPFWQGVVNHTEETRALVDQLTELYS